MKLYERFTERGFHTSIATTFGIDFDAYETIVLPRLRGAGCHNNILMADGRMLTYALGGSLPLPRHAGRLYTVSGAKANGVFHPKLFLQLGRRGGRMIVGSANMTPSGLAGNLELAGEMRCDETESGEQKLIAAAWRYVLRQCHESEQALSTQTAWMLQRTPWLRRAEAADGPVPLADGTIAALLTTGERMGIGERFAALVDDGPVTRLTVISPYWDDDLQALGFLAQRLSTKDIALLIDPVACAFPVAAVARLEGVTLYSREDFSKGRFLHAKAVIAHTNSSDHVLYGSANCTIPALGRQGYAGSNEEICLYRRFPADSTLQALKLHDLFGEGRVIEPESLKPVESRDDIPLDDLAALTPGRFECQFDTLIWTPPGRDIKDSDIELLDVEGAALACQLTPLQSGTPPPRRYRIAGIADRPAFARLRYRDGSHSSPAIVTLIDRISAAAKEARSLRAERAAAQLAEETEEGIWLLGILDTLETAAQEQKDAKEPVSIPRKPAGKDMEPDPAQFRKLSYEDFIKTRQPRAPEFAIPRNSLAGSELSIARGFLNRILGLGTGEEPEDDVDEERRLQRAFDLGDETADAAKALEGGVEFGTAPETIRTKTEEQQERERKAAERRATQEQIAKAVEGFNARLATRKADGSLTTFDILRLRAVVTIVASAGWTEHYAGAGPQKKRTSFQVLPVENGGESWPRILGRALFGFFSGRDPAIRHIKIDAIHDQVPNDILECWATCFWAIQACLAAPCSSTERAAITQYIKPVAEKVYRLTGLRQEELMADNICTVMNKLSERFSARLGIDATAITNAHKATMRDVFARAKPAATAERPNE